MNLPNGCGSGWGGTIGRNDACELWTDLKLAANARRSAAVEEKIGDCAVMIIVHSNFYLESAWCRTEMSQFLEQELTRRTGTGSPVFVVETLNVERPPALKKLDLLGKRFWYMDPLTNRVHTMGFSKAERGDSRYINQIIELSEDIAAELKRQKEENSRARANTGGAAAPDVRGGDSGRASPRKGFRIAEGRSERGTAGLPRRSFRRP